jgi:hypothetical protein
MRLLHRAGQRGGIVHKNIRTNTGERKKQKNKQYRKKETHK